MWNWQIPLWFTRKVAVSDPSRGWAFSTKLYPGGAHAISCRLFAKSCHVSKIAHKCNFSVAIRSQIAAYSLLTDWALIDPIQVIGGSWEMVGRVRPGRIL